MTEGEGGATAKHLRDKKVSVLHTAQGQIYRKTQCKEGKKPTWLVASKPNQKNIG